MTVRVPSGCFAGVVLAAVHRAERLTTFSHFFLRQRSQHSLSTSNENHAFCPAAGGDALVRRGSDNRRSYREWLGKVRGVAGHFSLVTDTNFTCDIICS